MNSLKLAAGILVLLLAFVLQFWFGVWGFYANFVFAALIVFAFLFEIWQFSFFVILAIFILNWQPGFSADIIFFVLIPIAVYAVRTLFHPNQLIGVAIAIVAGLSLFYLLIAPAMIIHSFESFFIDIVLSLLFGELIILSVPSS